MDIRVGNENETVALKTKFGWVIFGERQNTNKYPNINAFFKEFDPKNIILKFWIISCLRKAKTQTFYHKRNNML